MFVSLISSVNLIAVFVQGIRIVTWQDTIKHAQLLRDKLESLKIVKYLA